MFRTEVKKKKNAPVTISHTRISDIGELPPGQKPPHSFGTFRGATRQADKSVDDVTIFSRLRANSGSVTYRKKKKKSATPPYGHLGNMVTSLLQPTFFWLPGKTAIHFLVKNRRKKATR